MPNDIKKEKEDRRQRTESIDVQRWTLGTREGEFKVKSTGCSLREPGFGFQYQVVAHNRLKFQL